MNIDQTAAQLLSTRTTLARIYESNGLAANDWLKDEDSVRESMHSRTEHALQEIADCGEYFSHLNTAFAQRVPTSDPRIRRYKPSVVDLTVIQELAAISPLHFLMLQVSATGNNQVAELTLKDRAREGFMTVRAGFYAKIRVDWENKEWYPNTELYATPEGLRRQQYIFPTNLLDAAKRI